ncbi:2-C-methyl-D-erythritol 4-phosphate cytidylyltransferase, partial [Persephonella sp.]
MKIVALLLAAGSGKRFGEKKQFIKLKGEPLFQYSLNTVNKIDVITDIVLVLPPEDVERIKVFSFKNVIKVAGGGERQESVFNGLMAAGDADIVVVHDTARPFATERMFIDGINNVKKGWDGSITALKARDTIKVVRDDTVVDTPNRKKLSIAPTPQTFYFHQLFDAPRKTTKQGVTATND